MNQSEIDAIVGLVNASNLEDVQYHELSITRVNAADSEEARGEGVAGSLGVRPQFRMDKNSFGFRLIGEINADFGKVRVAVASEYALTDEHFELSEPLVKTFGNEVGIMALYPFLRESVATLTAKVFGKPLFVPLVERGEISFDEDEADVVEENATPN